MLAVLRKAPFRRLFMAQVLGLFGTGVLTVALALKAFELGGAAGAGLVLSGILTIKMVAYVGFAPVAAALSERRAPGPLLAMLDGVRCTLALALLATGAPWQILAIVLLFYLAAAAFTPTLQAAIPSVLPDSEDYTAALSLSRAAASLESLLSPLLAAAFLTVADANALFAVSALAFAVSAATLATARLGLRAAGAVGMPFRQRLTRGLSIYLGTPRLRGLLAAHLAMALPLAWVLVNSVGLAGVRFDVDGQAYAGLMAGYGMGAVLGALAVPRLLERAADRSVILTGAAGVGLLVAAVPLAVSYGVALALWCGVGLASALVMTPGGLVLTRSAAKPDRPAIFAAQFTFSHLAWLLAYPLAGALGASLGLVKAAVLLGLAGGGVALAAHRIWPAEEAEERLHSHPELPPDHPHLRGGRHVHSHVFVIDDLHPSWHMGRD